jgi:hypothetical protein
LWRDLRLPWKRAGRTPAYGLAEVAEGASFGAPPVKADEFAAVGEVHAPAVVGGPEHHRERGHDRPPVREELEAWDSGMRAGRRCGDR